MANILLVEDDETISFGIRSALAKKGHEVACCSGMEEGKTLFSAKFDLILLDLNLPDGNGYDFCSWVKERSDSPIIFLTVKDDVNDITRGLDMGADDYHETLSYCCAGIQDTGGFKTGSRFLYACLRQYPDGQEENAGVGGGGERSPHQP